ncbi:MAG: tetratricopeptide repeat protein [Pseudomonadota bacterium]
MIIRNAALIAAALTASTAGFAQSATQSENETQLSAEALGQGDVDLATRALEKALRNAPQDPALLINMGIARANAGKRDEARALFNRALTSPEPVELETADGRLTDSRRLARRALAMLDRGEFAPVSARQAALD